MINWHSIPFARLLIPFTIGIVVYNCSPGALPYSILLIILACGFLLFERSLSIKAKFKYKTWTSISLISLFMSLGMVSSHFASPELQKDHYSNIHNIHYLHVKITDVLDSKKDKARIIAEAINCIDAAKLKFNCSGLVLINLKIKGNFKLPEIGQTYWLKAKLIKPEFNENPGTFDYGTYLKRKDILYCINTASNKICKSEEAFFHLRKTAYKLRDHCLVIFKEYIPNKISYGISEALILGYKSDLSEDTNQIFTRTGTLHILAVSGMHAGLIFAVLNWMFGFLTKLKQGHILKALLILFSLWFYALMSGFSASVIRAVVMFSLISIGKLLYRSNIPINTIYSSAFVMLVYDPNYLFDPGFQLSYAAVLGIAFAYSKLRGIYIHRSKAVISVCDLINLSLCAQILTFPIGIFYFNQFPSYFLLTNLIVIPVYSLLIFILLAILPLSVFPLIPNYLGKLTDKLIQYNDIFMHFMDRLPYATIDHLHLDYIELFLLYILLLKIIHSGYFKVRISLLFALTILSILIPYESLKYKNIQNQKFISMMGFRNADIFVCVEGDKCFIYGDSLSFRQKSIINDLNKFFLKYDIKSKYMIQEKNSFVSTNFRSISGLGFQFFDRIVTKQNTAHLSGQNGLFYLFRRQENSSNIKSNFNPSNLIISHKIQVSKKTKIQNELFKRFRKKINISSSFHILCQF